MMQNIWINSFNDLDTTLAINNLQIFEEKGYIAIEFEDNIIDICSGIKDCFHELGEVIFTISNIEELKFAEILIGKIAEASDKINILSNKIEELEIENIKLKHIIRRR